MQKTFRALTLVAALALPALVAATFSGCASAPETSLSDLGNKYGASYAVVVSEKTCADAGWKKVVDTLVRKRNATPVVYAGSIENARAELAKKMPRHTAFVATPEELADDRYAALANLLVRQLDGDDYADTIAGIVTGNTAEEALAGITDLSTIFLKKSDAAPIIKAVKSGNPVRITDGDNLVQSVTGAPGITPENPVADTLALWQTPPGRNSLAESFFFAAPPKPAGNNYSVPNFRAAFYGDPARRVVIKSDENSFVTGGITTSGTVHTFKMEILNYDQATTNEVPLGVIFTKRIKNPKILSGDQYMPILTDNFILLKNPRPQAGEKEIVVKFEGAPIEE